MIAVTALIVYALYFYALIKMIPITLSLPGIAGLILTIGVAADANIVIFERVKEEFRGGSSIGRAIATGYKRGIAAIIDANVVTFMTAFILFVLATAEVKGFAFTLGIGTLASLFTAVAATQAILGSMGRSRLISSASALGAKDRGRRWSYDFMGASKWFFSLSGTILLDRRPRDRRPRPQLRHRLPVGHADQDGADPAGDRERDPRGDDRQRRLRRRDPEGLLQGARQERLPDLDAEAPAGRRPEDPGRAARRSSAGRSTSRAPRSARPSARPSPSRR